MGDGIMAVFRARWSRSRAVLAAARRVKSVEVDGYTPRMRVGIHTGRPQRIGSDWLGVDVNIAARVMERATKGGVIVSGPTLDQIRRTTSTHWASPPNGCASRCSPAGRAACPPTWRCTG